MSESKDNAYFSNNNIDWIVARDYQYNAITQAIKWYSGSETSNTRLDNTKLVYRYNKNDIIFTLTPYKSDNIMETVFVMTRENGSIAYLKLVKNRYTKMIAQPGYIVTAEYLGKTININTGETYYVDNSTNKIAVGWHGSYNPPCDMDGMPVVF